MNRFIIGMIVLVGLLAGCAIGSGEEAGLMAVLLPRLHILILLKRSLRLRHRRGQLHPGLLMNYWLWRMLR